jgi:hypothetical protein
MGIRNFNSVAKKTILREKNIGGHFPPLAPLPSYAYGLNLTCAVITNYCYKVEPEQSAKFKAMTTSDLTYFLLQWLDSPLGA